MIPWLDADNPVFPSAEQTLKEPAGLLCAGGNLNIDTLLDAYSRGLFPWFNDDQPILWWSPDPRMVITPDTIHLSKRLCRTLRNTSMQIIRNKAFGDVIAACSSIPRQGQGGSWITDDMIHAYQTMHQSGHAHSVEVWNYGQLVGGLYGIAIGRVFFGESMFSLEQDTSKMALAALIGSGCFDLIDCQIYNNHLASLGAVEIPRRQFLERVNKSIELKKGPRWTSESGGFSWMIQ